MLQEFLEILKYILPAIVVLIATTLIVNKFLVKEIERKQLAIFQQNSNMTLQMRLQAYERLAIFVERDGFADVVHDDLAGVAPRHVLLEFLADGGVHCAIHIFIQHLQ